MEKNFSLKSSAPGPEDHHEGYVTLLGDYSHPPRKSSSLASYSSVCCDTHDEDRLLESLKSIEEALKMTRGNLPGDFNLRPHEKAFLYSKIFVKPDLVHSERADRKSSNRRPRSVDGESIATADVAKVDSTLNEYIKYKKNFKWNYPLSSNEISLYGDAYVKSMHCGPFRKTQLLVSRT